MPDPAISIMIVDDHHIVRYGLKQSLSSQENFRIVAEAGTGKEAIELMAVHSPDVILMDVSMPDLNGIEATRIILKSHPQTRIIALSMHAEKQYVLSMLKSGAKGYLLKNNLFEELVTAIHTVMEGNVFLSAQITEFIVQTAITPGSDDEAESQAIASLTSREREILQLVAEGKNNAEISKLLYISKKTVDNHKRHIMGKLDLHTIPALTKFAIKHGISSLDV
ncbi:MAG: DNA-binding response regulator [Desulfobacteraceae bacterium]|nr:MAG: DNA-binding response regulator [Desulfobacteraceae bacterium]